MTWDRTAAELGVDGRGNGSGEGRRRRENTCCCRAFSRTLLGNKQSVVQVHIVTLVNGLERLVRGRVEKTEKKNMSFELVVVVVVVV